MIIPLPGFDSRTSQNIFLWLPNIIHCEKCLTNQFLNEPTSFLRISERKYILWCGIMNQNICIYWPMFWFCIICYFCCCLHFFTSAGIYKEKLKTDTKFRHLIVFAAFFRLFSKEVFNRLQRIFLLKIWVSTLTPLTLKIMFRKLFFEILILYEQACILGYNECKN